MMTPFCRLPSAAAPAAGRGYGAERGGHREQADGGAGGTLGSLVPGFVEQHVIVATATCAFSVHLLARQLGSYFSIVTQKQKGRPDERPDIPLTADDEPLKAE